MHRQFTKIILVTSVFVASFVSLYFLKGASLSDRFYNASGAILGVSPNRQETDQMTIVDGSKETNEVIDSSGGSGPDSKHAVLNEVEESKGAVDGEDPTMTVGLMTTSASPSTPTEDDVPSYSNFAPVSDSGHRVEEVNKSSIANAKPGEVVLLTASSGNNGFLSIPGLKDMVYENRKSYAERWGYEFMWANITSYDFGAKIYWNKIPILQEAFSRFPKVKWIFWLDLDIIIMTPSVDLHSLVLSNEGMMKHILNDTKISAVGGGPLGFNTLADPDPDDMNMIIAQDNWGQNVGSFFMRRSDWTDFALEMWMDPLATAQNWTFPENDGWTHLYKNHEIVRNHTAIVSQRSINAYPSYNKLGHHWQRGDFLVHFAGCGDHPHCAGHWNEMWIQRENYTVSETIRKDIEDGTAQIETVQKGDYLQ